MPTVQEQVYQVMREKLLAGHWNAGQRLGEVAVAEELGVNRNPVREAIVRLAGEGLLERQPGVGARVIEIDADHITHLFQLRIAVEGMAARLAATRITPAELARLEAEHVLMQKLTGMGQDRELKDSEDRFHRMILEVSGNPLLLSLWNRNMIPAGLQKLVPPRHHGTHGTHRIAFRGHKRIVDALRARDPDAAEAALRWHLEGGLKQSLALIKLGGKH